MVDPRLAMDQRQDYSTAVDEHVTTTRSPHGMRNSPNLRSQILLSSELGE